MTAWRSVLKSPPTVPMFPADCALVTCLVVIGKVVRVEPAGTVTLGGTVAAAVLSLDRSITNPPEGAAAGSGTVPGAGSPPTTSVGLRVSADSEVADDDGGGGCDAVHPDSVLVADV